jgi:hypothetical protein
MKLPNHLVMLLLAASFNEIFAEPSLEPSAAGLANLSSIKKGITSSNILADESNPNLFYVLPPNTGYGYSQGLVPNANMGFCSELSTLQRLSASTLNRIAELEMEKSNLVSVFAPLMKEAGELRTRAAKYAAASQLTELIKLDDLIVEETGRLDDLYDRREKCQDSECDNIDLEIYSVQKNKDALEKQRTKLIVSSGDDGRKYKKFISAAEAKEAEAKSYKKPYEDIQDSLKKAKADYLSAYDMFGLMEAATSHFTYESGWQKNVESLREANPQFSFELAKTKNAKIMPELVIDKMNPNASVKNIYIPGSTLENGVVGLSSYPESVSANIGLTNIAACPIQYPNLFKPNMDGDKVKFGVVATYDYATIFRSQVTATFNMKKVMERIEQTSKKRRIIRSSSSTSVTERNDYNDIITFTWEDRSNAISAEEKAKREEQIRTSIFTRIAYLAMPNANERAKLINAGPVPASGASVISATITQTCPTNAYCVGAAAALTILDNIFGGGSSTANFKSIKDVNLVERYTAIGSIDHSASTSYKF